jgi:lysyl-tRNA synthetase class 2
MLEFYQAYSDYLELMDLTEDLFRSVAEKVCGTAKAKYGEVVIDFGKFERLSMREAICKYWPAAASPAPVVTQFTVDGGTRSIVERYNGYARSRGLELIEAGKLSDGELTGELFENIAESHLIQPTFIFDFPTAISPLSKCREDDPTLTERFELFIAGMELANGFSELNDPADQERRFRAQVEKGGLEAPKEVDVDYIRALSHGLPPTAGEGVGIDRLVMLLTDSQSIREVVLFPLLRAESAEPLVAASNKDLPTTAGAGGSSTSSPSERPK